MNSEAASETQYEDSKSHLSTYRKDNKSMLRRKVLTLLLALVLVVSMAVPALAASWSGTYGGVRYDLYISKGVTTASARFTYGATVQVRLLASAIVAPSGSTSFVADRADVCGAATAYASLTNGDNGSEPIALVVTNSYAGSDLVISKTY